MNKNWNRKCRFRGEIPESNRMIMRYISLEYCTIVYITDTYVDVNIGVADPAVLLYTIRACGHQH